MAQITEERKSIEQPFMNVFWKFRKEYGDPENTETYWSNFVDEINSIAANFNNDPYIVSVLLCCFDDIEVQAHRKFGTEFRYHNYDLLLGVVNRLRKHQGKPPVKLEEC